MMAANQGHDERLAQLVDELADRLAAGDDSEIDRLATAHPKFASELRELWGARGVGVKHGRDASATRPSLDR